VGPRARMLKHGMDIAQVLSFWFGQLSDDGLADTAHVQSWWRKDAAFDAEVKARFLTTWQKLSEGTAPAPKSPDETLAMVIVLDQFPRNMFRGEARSFASDARALTLAHAATDAGEDRALLGQQRSFLYMPFMHSENLEDQEQCVALFARFRDESSGTLRADLDRNVRFAERHRDIIARFARFPHRNQLLARASTPDELEFLRQPGSSF